MLTDWWCDKCHASGVVRHRRDIDLFEMNGRITAAHEDSQEAYRENCRYDPMKVHVHIRKAQSAAKES